MAVLATGNSFSTGDQVTAAALNAAVNSATFDTGAVDGSTTQISGGAIIVKDGGVTAAKLASTTGSGSDVVLSTSPTHDEIVAAGKQLEKQGADLVENAYERHATHIRTWHRHLRRAY